MMLCKMLTHTHISRCTHTHTFQDASISLQLSATRCNSQELSATNLVSNRVNWNHVTSTAFPNTATHCNSLDFICRVDWHHIMCTVFPNTTAHFNCN
mmetsp:Transcript_11174/g.16000  ORF Transcript_11174/g.16000 Transcript_11174/m.16000 type:complete len:97 (+) Transcript_11174:163-453(+)